MPSFKAFAELQQKAKGGSGEAPSAAAAKAAPSSHAQPPSAAAATAAPSSHAQPPHAAASASEDKAAAISPPSDLKIGMPVRICNLTARPELNGLEGVLTAWDGVRGRWQVELKSGGAKLFKVANVEKREGGDAMNVLKAKATAGATTSEQPPLVSAPPAAVPPVSAPQAAGPSSDRPAAADAPARASPFKKPDAPQIFPVEEDDDEAFMRSIEQCLKECDVMWDDY
mmetsp:Transcript_98862/g.247896  ORF Transcript_98862/g.247896 Transcript_98862/m.247896 type:complete len:227 (-) Transcript_98862:38-718(-)